ncbi:MAG: Fur family transcriptional regulator [Clostridia bacterium]|nr:Fur family transcriptional regulator [Clostridia bacterium]
MYVDIEDLKEKLQSSGYKLTTQRRAIIDTFIENEGKHLNTEEIYELVRTRYPEIGLATVYRTLQILEDMDIIYKHNFDDKCSRYELNHKEEDHHHHHLICLKCGKVIEVEDDLLDELEDKIDKNNNFKIINHKVKFFGYCSDCR